MKHKKKMASLAVVSTIALQVAAVPAFADVHVKGTTQLKGDFTVNGPLIIVADDLVAESQALAGSVVILQPSAPTIIDLGGIQTKKIVISNSNVTSILGYVEPTEGIQLAPGVSVPPLFDKNGNAVPSPFDKAAVAAAAANLSVNYNGTDATVSLPNTQDGTTVTWALKDSSHSSIVDVATGVVTRPGDADTVVVLVATITKGAATATKEISITVKKADIAAPAFTADTTNATVGNLIEITFPANADWESKITAVELNGSAVDLTMYTVAPGKITLDASLFPTDGNYDIVVKAVGYTDANVKQTVTPEKNDETLLYKLMRAKKVENALMTKVIFSNYLVELIGGNPIHEKQPIHSCA